METDLPDEVTVKLARDAARAAARAAKLALLCLVVAALVLAIDNRIKKHIIEEGRKALTLLAEARKLAEEARGGVPGTVQDRAAPGPAVNGADGVVHAAGAPATPGYDARGGAGATFDRPPGES